MIKKINQGKHIAVFNPKNLIKKSKIHNLNIMFYLNIPRLSHNIAIILDNKFPCLYDLVQYLNTYKEYNQKIDSIANIKYNTSTGKERRIGKKISEQIIHCIFLKK